MISTKRNPSKFIVLHGVELLFDFIAEEKCDTLFKRKIIVNRYLQGGCCARLVFADLYQQTEIFCINPRGENDVRRNPLPLEPLELFSKTCLQGCNYLATSVNSLSCHDVFLFQCLGTA